MMDPSPLSPSWQFTPTALVAHAVPGVTKEKGKESRAIQLALSRSWRPDRILPGPISRQLPQSRSFTAYRILSGPIISWVVGTPRQQGPGARDRPQ